MIVSEITSTLKRILHDRPFFGIVVGFLVICVAYCIYAGLSLHQASTQVVVRYTGFGSTHFYRDHWLYMLTFVGFGAFSLLLNTAIAAKLLYLDKRPLAIAWIIGSMGLMVIAAIVTHSVVGVRYL